MNQSIRQRGSQHKKPSERDPAPARAVFLFGPTAVGKTKALSVISRSLPGVEVISADSVQVYRGLDIGSAKPESDDLASLPHHNIDVRNPDENYSVADFVAIADAAISDISSRGGIPLVSGGTAFYLKHLWFGLPESPPANPVVAAALAEELKLRGIDALRSELRSVDEVSWDRIAPADHYRILRALEVFRSSGRPLSSYALPSEPRDGLDVLALGLTRDRRELYERIDRRVEVMFDRGLEGEVAGLLRAGYGPEAPGMKAIGYREFMDIDIRNRLLACKPLEDLQRQNLIGDIQQASRRFAKRQLTFFRSLPSVHWLEADDTEGITDLVRGFFP